MAWLRTIASGIGVAAGVLWRNLKRLTIGVFGRWEWHAPVWLSRTASQSQRSWRYLKANPRHAAVVAAAALAAAASLVWYLTRPTPHYVSYTVTPPGLTEYNDNGISSIKPLRIVFSESAAPLLQVEKAVLTGIDMSPEIAGTWFWTTDRELTFTPRDDWPVDGDFSIRLARNGLFGERVVLEQYRVRVRSQPFAAQIAESQFYQDPRNPNLKKLVATLKFSHPVDIEHFEEHVALSVAKDAEYLGLTPDSRHFTVAYDKFRLSAFIHSAALGMPRDDTPMTLTLTAGVRAARGGNDTPAPLAAVVVVPGRTSLRFSDARMTVVDNARYEPEQILLMTSSSPVVERALTSSVTARLLPERHPRQAVEDKRPYQWRNPGEIGAEILAASEPLSLSYVAADEGGDTSHGFKFRAPVGRFLHLTVKDGVQGTGGYLSGKPYVATVKVGPYHRALGFLGQGSLLSLSGEKTIGFLSRDVEQVDVEIARVLPNQLQHLAPQMWDFSRPSLFANMEDKLVERFTTTRDYSGKEPGKPTYDSVDVGQYLDAAPGRRGLFLLHLRARGSLVEADEDEDEDHYRDSDDSLQDTRLVLVTDLGFIVKQAKDGGRDVFVQSIRTGSPVEGARVELLGSNGQPILEAATDASGRAQLPAPHLSKHAAKRRPRSSLSAEMPMCLSCRSLRAAAI